MAGLSLMVLRVHEGFLITSSDEAGARGAVVDDVTQTTKTVRRNQVIMVMSTGTRLFNANIRYDKTRWSMQDKVRLCVVKSLKK